MTGDENASENRDMAKKSKKVAPATLMIEAALYNPGPLLTTFQPMPPALIEESYSATRRSRRRPAFLELGAPSHVGHRSAMTGFQPRPRRDPRKIPGWRV